MSQFTFAALVAAMVMVVCAYAEEPLERFATRHLTSTYGYYDGSMMMSDDIIEEDSGSASGGTAAGAMIGVGVAGVGILAFAGFAAYKKFFAGAASPAVPVSTGATL